MPNIKFVDRYYPSTKTCSYCWNIKGEMKLSERTYHCDNCWALLDRDINASLNILKEWKSLYTPVKTLIDFNSIPYITTYWE